VDQPTYRVLLEGRMVGPYDRKTILGMRIKQTLSSDDLLVSSEGARMTVRELVRQEQPARFQPGRTGGFSKVQATYAASLIDSEGTGPKMPPFKGELELRVQGDVLRLAGRYRRLLRWQEDRCKIALDEVTNTQVEGSRVDLWLRASPSAQRPRIALDLLTPEAAAELVEWLPLAHPMPAPAPRLQPVAAAPASNAQVLGIAVTGVALVLGVMLIVLLLRRVY
jgi:hypothetical protein